MEFFISNSINIISSNVCYDMKFIETTHYIINVEYKNYIGSIIYKEINYHKFKKMINGHHLNNILFAQCFPKGDRFVFPHKKLGNVYYVLETDSFSCCHIEELKNLSKLKFNHIFNVNLFKTEGRLTNLEKSKINKEIVRISKPKIIKYNNLCDDYDYIKTKSKQRRVVKVRKIKC